jgi:hypothetical protein
MRKFSDFINENASQSFEEKTKKAFQLLKDIKSEIDKMKEEQKKNPNSWGYTGSMGHVEHELKNLLTFLQGTEE